MHESIQDVFFTDKPFFLYNLFLFFSIVFIQTYTHPDKYIRLASPPTSSSSCSSSYWILPSSQDFSICCINTSSSSSPCYYGMDYLHTLTHASISWSFAFIHVFLMYCFLPKTTTRTRTLFQSLSLSFSLLFFRTCILYIGLNKIQDTFIPYPPPSSCWYAPYRKNKQCMALFDFTDHLILLYVHFILPLWMYSPFTTSSSSSNTITTVLLKLWWMTWNGIVVYYLLYTTAYFHSPIENIVAIVILMTSFLFIYCYNKTRKDTTTIKKR